MTEEIAEPGLALLRAAGHDVDVSARPLGRRTAGDAMPGAAALIIRSATQVTAEVIEAGP